MQLGRCDLTALEPYEVEQQSPSRLASKTSETSFSTPILKVPKIAVVTDVRHLVGICPPRLRFGGDPKAIPFRSSRSHVKAAETLWIMYKRFHFVAPVEDISTMGAVWHYASMASSHTHGE